jgi:hypothetical protein
MTLGDFLNHIKHKSLKITIYSNLLKPKVWFEGTIGKYSTSLVKDKINNQEIQLIVPNQKGELDIRIVDQYDNCKFEPMTPNGR